MNARPERAHHARPVGSIGPGSQAAADDLPIGCLGLPERLSGYAPPLLPEPDAVRDLTAAMGLLSALRILLSGYRVGALPQVMDLASLDAANLRLIEETLGIGEVSVQVAGRPPGSAATTADETRLAGVWRVRRLDAAGRVQRDVLEIADVPGVVRFTSFDAARDAVPRPDPLPDGVMNAPGVLAELNARVAARVAGDDAAGVINLSLLPQTAADLALLDTALGTGPVTMLARGYGRCRMTATLLREVWWVRHYNADDRLILNTLEVTDCPVAALAAQQDLEDSALRLHELLEAMT